MRTVAGGVFPGALCWAVGVVVGVGALAGRPPLAARAGRHRAPCCDVDSSKKKGLYLRSLAPWARLGVKRMTGEAGGDGVVFFFWHHPSPTWAVPLSLPASSQLCAHVLCSVRLLLWALPCAVVVIAWQSKVGRGELPPIILRLPPQGTG